MKAHELAYEDYKKGMKYQDIADKYSVSVNTVKSWKKRYGWQRIISQSQSKKGATSTKKGAKNTKGAITPIDQKKRKEIEKDLIRQLKENGSKYAHHIDLIRDYLSLWDIKNKLITDIEERGVTVTWTNGKQKSQKKNDSISELNKTSAQMLKILSELGLKVIEQREGEGDDI